MITRTYINGDIAALKTVLESSGFFASAEYDDPDSPTAIILKDAENRTLAEISLSGIKAYVSAETSKQVTFQNGILARTAYSCPNGTIIAFDDMTSTHNQGHLMITTTNADSVAFIFSMQNYPQSARANAFKNIYCVAWGDDLPISSYALSSAAHSQTVLVPFPTNSPASHTEDAFYTLFGSYYSTDYLEFSLDGQNYFTTGYWAVRDSGLSG